LIRQWFDSRVNSIWNRINKVAGKSGLASEIRSRWMEVIYVLGIILMTAGLVNAVLQPVNIGYVIFPSSSDQSATETGVDALALMIGAAGVYLSYLSGRQTTQSRMVNFYLTISILMIGIAVYIGIYVIASK
jgi:hypothetical protein